MCIERTVKIVKYWLKLYSHDNGIIILSVTYHQMADDMDKIVTNWVAKVRGLLESSGFPGEAQWLLTGSCRF